MNSSRPLVAHAPLETLDADALYGLWARCQPDVQHDGMRLDYATLYRTRVAPTFAPGAGATVDLVIPAWRERHRIGRSIALVARFLAEFPLDIRVTYVIEASDDGTLETARDAAAEHERIDIHDNRVQRGKGYAVRCGMHMTDGDVVAYNDTDLAVPLHQLLVTLATFAANPALDVIIGHRQRLSERSLMRRTMTRACRMALAGLSGLPAQWDPQCGFKAFRRAAASRLFSHQRIDGFAFDAELLLLARRLGLGVDLQQVPWLNDERSTVRPVMDVLAVARELASLRLAGGPDVATPAREAGPSLLVRPTAEPRSGRS